MLETHFKAYITVDGYAPGPWRPCTTLTAAARAATWRTECPRATSGSC